jgi:uncharacterized protein YeaO (DUF488 family)
MVDNPIVRVRRVYDEPHPDDGTRVLVDRLWPRGMSKTRARLDQWYPAAAPSTQLRTWYHHQPERFDEFTRRYLDELTQPERADALAHLRDLAENGPLTLLTASKAADISEAATGRSGDNRLGRLTLTIQSLPRNGPTRRQKRHPTIHAEHHQGPDLLPATLTFPCLRTPMGA